jgi:FKBP-type peptidyl-prolyl cis-trans isomerase
MRKAFAYCLLLWLFVGFASCGAEEDPRPRPLTDAELKAAMDSLDRLRTSVEKMEILSFIEKTAWPLVDARSGVWYWVYETSNLDTIHPSEGDVVGVRYEVRLLNDTLCYTNFEDELPEQFLVNLDNVESGLHEGITYMTVGDKAKFILASVRAHGLLGDMDMIPPSSPIVFDIELVSISKANAQ